jgi:hypothetical protein
MGAALALAVLSRPSAALFVVATAGTLTVLRRWRGLLWLMTGGLPLLAWMIFLNTSQFGDPLRGGYLHDNWQESPPWFLGLGGLLIAPSRGVLVYSPALLLVPLGAYALLRGSCSVANGWRILLLAWSLAAGMTLWFYSRWYAWPGGWCYGPRFMCETMPVLCLLFALAYHHRQSRRLRYTALGLVALSVAVHFVGVFGHSGYTAWQERHHRPDLGRCLFEMHDTQIEAHVRAFLRRVVRMEDALSAR